MQSLSMGCTTRVSTRACRRPRRQRSVFLFRAPRGGRCRRGLRRASASKIMCRRAASVTIQSVSLGKTTLKSSRAFRRPRRQRSFFHFLAPRGDRCRRGLRRASASETPRRRAVLERSPTTTTVRTLSYCRARRRRQRLLNDNAEFVRVSSLLLLPSLPGLCGFSSIPKYVTAKRHGPPWLRSSLAAAVLSTPFPF